MAQDGNLSFDPKQEVAALKKGMEQSTPAAKKAAAALAREVVDATKAALAINSPSRIMRDEVGAMLVKGMAQGITQNGKEVIAAFKRQLDALAFQRDFDVIDQDAYYAGLEQLRDRYFARGSLEWLKYTQQIYEYQQKQQKMLEEQQKLLEKQQKKIRDVYTDIAETVRKNVDGVLEKQRAFSDALLDNARVADQIRVLGGGANGGNLELVRLHDYTQDIKDLTAYQAMVQKGKERLGAYLPELLEQGYDTDVVERYFARMEALSKDDRDRAVKALATVPEEAVRRAIFSFAQYAKLTDADAVAAYRGEMEEAIAAPLATLQEKLGALGEDIPQGFALSGSLSAQRFGDAFVQEIQGLVTEIETVVASATPADPTGQAPTGSIGVPIVPVIPAQAAEEAATGLADTMRATLAKAGLIVPEGFFASGKTAAEQFGTAFLAEWERQMEQVRKRLDLFNTSIVPHISLTGGGGTGGATTNNTTTYVLNSSGETVSQQLRSADAHKQLEWQRNG